MYIVHAIIDGLKILGFDRRVIQRVSKEKSLEDIFLSTLFVNYMVVLVCFLVTIAMGGQLYLEDRMLNMPVTLGFMLMYPFAFNVAVYLVYSFFGLMAELIDTKKHIRPLLSTGFHTAITYALILYGIAILITADIAIGLFVLSAFVFYFLITMFYVISVVYKYSFAQALMVLLIPLLLLGIVVMATSTFIPSILDTVLSILFV